MLRRRLVAALAALLLAGVGAVLLRGYAAGADQRAMAGMKTVSVLVVTAPVAKGTAGEALRASVASKTLPASAVVAGRVTSLKEVTGKVTTTNLVAGEQLLASRFSTPAPVRTNGGVQIPEGMQQVSMQLDAQQVLGGNLSAGARVGVFISSGQRAHRALHRVLVSRVQGGLVSATPSANGSSTSTTSAPGSVIVTFVVGTSDAETLIAATGRVWLSLEVAAPSAAATATTGGDQ